MAHSFSSAVGLPFADLVAEELFPVVARVEDAVAPVLLAPVLLAGRLATLRPAGAAARHQRERGRGDERRQPKAPYRGRAPSADRSWEMGPVSHCGFLLPFSRECPLRFYASGGFRPVSSSWPQKPVWRDQ